MKTVERIRMMVAGGMTYEAALDVAAAFEEDMGAVLAMLGALVPKRDEQAERRRAADRDRKRPKAESSAEIPRNSADPSPSSSPSPGPSSSSTNLNPNTPYSPPKPRRGAVSALAEELWALQPAKHRRSTRADVQAALTAAEARGATPPELRAAVRAYYRHPDQTKSDGEFAKGCHRLLHQDRWRDFLPSPEPPGEPPTERTLAARTRHFHDTGEWRPEWGDRPTALTATESRSPDPQPATTAVLPPKIQAA